MNNKEEKALNDIIDEIINFTDFISKTSYENSLKSAQVVRDLSVAYLNVIEASNRKGWK